MAWWQQARFGMLVTWGISSVPAGYWRGKPVTLSGSHIMATAGIPIPEYEKFAARFNPVKFDAEQWATIAQDAGMKYLVITAKHHDGFCMFKTAITGYNVVEDTPWRRDPMAELSEACQNHGVRFCTYYSIMDWHSDKQLPENSAPESLCFDPTHFDPAAPEKKAAYVAYMNAQIKELIAQYHPGVMWFDGAWVKGWTAKDGQDLLLGVRKLDPQIIVNDRTGGGGDYATPEEQIPASAPRQYWETCMTMNQTWGYKSDDHDFKTPRTLIRNLIDIASKGGNYLLNVGPTADGEIPREEVDILKEMGRWLRINGEAIYGTAASPLTQQPPWGRCTASASAIYLFVFDWPKDGQLTVPISTPILQAALLATPEQALQCAQTAGAVTIQLPAQAPDSTATVIKLELHSSSRL
jgi:alpha-L-fucosidase